MRRLTDTQVDQIAHRLIDKMGADAVPGVACLPGATLGDFREGTPPTGLPAGGYVSAPVGVSPARPSPRLSGDGVFPTVDECVQAATTAFHYLSEGTLAKRREIIAAIRAAMLRDGDRLAKMAMDETGLGRYEHKVIKNKLVAEKTPGPESLLSMTTSGDDGLTLMEWAPFGVIGAITPTTNPTSTIICNSLGMLSAGNSVVFNVHPGAVECSMETVRIINKAITDAGGPQNLVTAVGNPTIESAGELMHHAGINLLVVTGGPGVVAAAMKSGKRSVSAGPGNPPVVVDETADISKAGRDIVFGAGFDNNIICVDEKEVFVVESVADELIQVMRNEGAYLVDQAQMRRLEKVTC